MPIKKPKSTRPVGRPRLNLPTKPRHFLQVERNREFNQDLEMLRHCIALDRNILFSEVSQSEAVRYAVHFYVNRGQKK